MKSGRKILVVALLFVALVLVNYLASQLPVRADATAEGIYTLSPGTKSLLSKIEEPVTLDFYFSTEARGLPISYKNYAARVEEMLRQYARSSRGKLVLNVIHPEPDTPAEEKAAAAGLQPQLIPGTGEQIYFGVVATQADQQKAITAFSPQREQFLEYDLSQLLHSVGQFDRRKLGLLTSLPLQAPPFNPMMMQMGQRPQPSQFVISEWEKTFEIVSIEASATALPADLDALAVIHPQNLSPQLQFAIDQFLLDGKPVLLAVDPSSQYFKAQGGQQAMFGGRAPAVSSDVPTLLSGWGLQYDPENAVGDLVKAATVQTGPGVVSRYPVWLLLDRENINPTATPTAQLNSLLFVEPGSFSLSTSVGLELTPLVETSDQAGHVATMTLGMTPPDALMRQLTPSGKKTIAGLVRGKFKSAFPSGAPAAETPPAPASDVPVAPGEKADRPAASPQSPANALKESRTTSTLIVVADTDWLLDEFSVRRFNFLGTQAAEPLNDNLALGSNALEFLAGSEDLISIRGKGSSVRPFTVVKAMEVEAQQKYQQQLTALEARLQEVQGKLADLQGRKTEGNQLVASPEMVKAIEEFQQQEASMRRERRDIRRALREDIDALENQLLLFNLLATPTLVCAFGWWFYRSRRR